MNLTLLQKGHLVKQYIPFNSDASKIGSAKEFIVQALQV